MFYKCAKRSGQDCNFFLWESQVCVTNDSTTEQLNVTNNEEEDEEEQYSPESLIENEIMACEGNINTYRPCN